MTKDHRAVAKQGFAAVETRHAEVEGEEVDRDRCVDQRGWLRQKRERESGGGGKDRPRVVVAVAVWGV